MTLEELTQKIARIINPFDFVEGFGDPSIPLNKTAVIISIFRTYIRQLPVLSDEEILKLIGLENYQNLVVDKIIAQAQKDTIAKSLEVK